MKFKVGDNVIWGWEYESSWAVYKGTITCLLSVNFAIVQEKGKESLIEIPLKKLKLDVPQSIQYILEED